MRVEDVPPCEPVSLAEAKAYLRVEHGDEDALIAGLIAAARGLCEAFTGLALIERRVVETVLASGDWRRLTATPVTAVIGVEGLPAEEPGFPLATDAYAVDIDANGDGWVRVTRPGSAGRARVTYRAGLATDWNGVAEPLRQGMLRLVAHLYAHRDGDGGAPPAAVTALWRPWRRVRL